MSILAATWPRQARGLYLVASGLFVVTVAIGIVNGLDLVDFSTDALRPTLLTHVHAGTVGWISLGIIAASLWLLRTGNAALAWAFGILVPAYVAAFYSGNLAARAIVGVVLLAAILWLFVWIWRRALAARSLPSLAVALGLTSFTYGAVIGVVIQIQFATERQLFPAGADYVGAHAATMTFSYLVLAAMGILEWRLMGTTGYPTLGVIQVVALFAAGLVLALALLFAPGATQAAGGLNLLLELVAIVLFIVRVWPTAVRTDWLAPGPERHWRLAAIFVPVAMALFMYIIALFIGAQGDVTAIPLGTLAALDHTVFVGVITNISLGLVLSLTADRRGTWPWADQLVFWVVNLGLIVFAVGLVAVSPEIKRIGAPIMGSGILVGLATIAMRLWSSDLRAAEAG